MTRRARLCPRHQGVVDPVAAQFFETVGGLGFHAHADPDIGVEHVRVRDGSRRVFLATHVRRRTQPRQQFGGRLVFLRRGDDQPEIFQAGRRPQPGNRDVARAVAEVADRFPAPGAESFLNREQVRENLTGVFRVREGVDRRQSAGGGEGFHVALRVGADHHAVQHPAEDAGGVLDGFAAAPELEVVGVEEKGIAAEFADADLETDARAGGRFIEDHPPAAVPQWVFVETTALGLHLAAQRDDPQDVLPRHGFDGKQITHETYFSM